MISRFFAAYQVAMVLARRILTLFLVLIPVLVLLLAGATAGFAQNLVQSAASDAGVPKWRIISENSTLAFDGIQMGAPFSGEFKNFSGTIQFDPARLDQSRADISIQTGSAITGSADRDKYLGMADWFDIANFPEAKFTTTSFEKGLDTNHYVARGDLKIRDIALPVTIPFALTFSTADSGEEIATMVGETSLNRLDFGVGQGQWSDTKSVENSVKLRINVQAAKIVAIAGAPPL